ncbi:MAG: ATP-binding protein [Thermodesulfobacteriota bacterium]|nr:ATP-binding protein [Thermodesulfobacteriota bacterium]
MKIPFSKINWDIVIWTGSFMVLGFVVFFAMYSYHGVEREMAGQFNKEQMLLAQQTAMGIEQHMGDISNILNITSRITCMTGGDASAIEEALVNAYSSLKDKVKFVFWEDSTGIMRFHYPEKILPDIDGKGFGFRTYFRVAKEMRVPFVSGIIGIGGKDYDDEPNRFETFVIAYPLETDDGSFKGVLGCVIDIANITAHYVAPMQPSRNGYAWLMDEAGTMLYHPDPHMLGMNLNDIILDLQKNKAMISGVEDIWHGMEFKNDGMYEFVFPHFPSKEPTHKFLAFSSVHFLNRRWITVVTSPYSELVHLMSGTFKNTMVLGSVSIGFVLIALLTMLRINRARVVVYERNKWAERVLLAHKRLETIFNGVPHYLAMIDSAFTISDVNQRYCDLYGMRRQDILGRHCDADFSKNARICHSDIIERCFTETKVVTENSRRVEIGDKPYFFEISAIPLLDAEGKVDSVVQYAMDITEEKTLTEKLLQADKLAAVGQMSAHVAHEIRNPLASILLQSELLDDELQDTKTSPEAFDFIKTIQGEIDRLSQITDEYLAYARLPHPRKQLLDPFVEVTASVAMLKPELKKNNIEIEIKKYDHDVKIKIDRGQFRQVLLNLIRNASDAMPSGGRMDIALMCVRNDFLLQVKDTGFGMSADTKRRIFDPYFTTKDNGTGLGLSLVQYIANAHNGWVDVESEKNKGSTFIFSVPYENKGDR